MTRSQDGRWGPAWRPDGQVLFQVWAPSENEIRLHLGGSELSMAKTEAGWHRVVAKARPGDAYGFRLSDGRIVPDPASRGQASDIDGQSLIPDKKDYSWQTANWQSRPWEEAVFYEIHIGTFTRAGTFRSAMERLRSLADLGVTAIELMPIAQFPGNRGWGYDGVLQYAPHRTYGSPNEFKALVDAAHDVGLMVFLDVVYNHFGPVGNHLLSYAPEFFRKESTPWGAAMNFGQSAVRSYFIENAVYWLTEFRLDGLRLDAVDQMEDDSPIHILHELSESTRRDVPGPRRYLVTENPANSIELLDHSCGPLFDADWNDDFHHSMHVAATGEGGGHYAPFSKKPWKSLNAALARGYVLEGRPLLASPTPGRKPPPRAFVHYLQNHDQTGNRALGERLISLIDEEAYGLWLEILLLSPQIPLLFQGDDYGEHKPFHFFVDTDDDRAEAIWDGRAKEADNFGGLPQGKTIANIPDANNPATFLKSKLRSTVDAPYQDRFRGKLRSLLTVRGGKVVPLLKEVQPGVVVVENDGIIAVNWPLADGVLQMRANFTSNNVDLPLRPGSLLHAREVQKWSDGSVILGKYGFALVRSGQQPSRIESGG